MNTIIRNEETGATLEFLDDAAMGWPAYWNKLRHIYLNQTTWVPELFEDKTREGLLHAIKSFLIYKGHSPNQITDIEDNETQVIECIVFGVKMTITASCINTVNKGVNQYDNRLFAQEDGSMKFISDSATDWLTFYDMMFFDESMIEKVD